MSGVDIAGLVEGLRNTRTPGAEFLCLRAADALLAQAAELAEANGRERKSIDDLCWWRAAFQKEQVFEANKKAVLSERRAVEATRQRDEALAALKAAREALEPFAIAAGVLISADSDETKVFSVSAGDLRRARSALENGAAALADATNNPPSDPGTEQREAGRG